MPNEQSKIDLGFSEQILVLNLFKDSRDIPSRVKQKDLLLCYKTVPENDKQTWIKVTN